MSALLGPSSPATPLPTKLSPPCPQGPVNPCAQVSRSSAGTGGLAGDPLCSLQSRWPWIPGDTVGCVADLAMGKAVAGEGGEFLAVRSLPSPGGCRGCWQGPAPRCCPTAAAPERQGRRGASSIGADAESPRAPRNDPRGPGRRREKERGRGEASREPAMGRGAVGQEGPCGVEAGYVGQGETVGARRNVRGGGCAGRMKGCEGEGRGARGARGGEGACGEVGVRGGEGVCWASGAAAGGPRRC